MVWFRGPENMLALGGDAKFFERVLSLGVDTICTNMPGALAKLRGKL